MSCEHAPAGGPGSTLRAARIRMAERMIEAQTFWSLPASHRAVIAEKLEELGEPVPGTPEAGGFDRRSAAASANLRARSEPLTPEAFDAAFAKVAHAVDREVFEGFSPLHQRMLAGFAEAVSGHAAPVQPCFGPGTDRALINAFEALVFPPQPGDGDDDNRAGALNPDAPGDPAVGEGPDIGEFQQGPRWTDTAFDPFGFGQGNPTILTYSFPEDGVNIVDAIGEGAAPNDLNAFFDGIYGDRATWRAFYDEIFARWAELCGNTYILEPVDDGAPLRFNGQFPGVQGFRGDMRMVGKPVDGNFGILAFNFFPPIGEMVIDTTDSFYANTQNNSLGLRNVLAHEHGHGMGQFHVCPATGSFLMEPFISTGFDGPQLDDILNAQRHYGDPLEPNDNIFIASPGGTLGDDTVTFTNVSLDDDLDVDVYVIEVDDVREIRATLRQAGFAYNAGPQTEFCDEAAPYNPTLFLDPKIEWLDNTGAVLGSADENGAGAGEELGVIVGPGAYYVRVTGSDPSGDQIIPYELDISSGSFIEPSGDLATTAAPGERAELDFVINPAGVTAVGATIRFRSQGESSFRSREMEPLVDGVFRATLPPFNCGDDPEYFIVADLANGGSGVFPLLGEDGPLSLFITDGEIVQVDANGEQDVGFTVSGNAIDGRWERGLPQGNNRGDPAVDADGSGQAWLTGISEMTTNSDVDEGRTVLETPSYDFAAGGFFRYSYWFAIVGPPVPGQFFSVEYSTNNGASWNEIRRVESSDPRWNEETIDIDTEIGASASIRFRFIAADEGPVQGIVEAGVDAIRGSATPCTPVELCPADTNEDGVLNGADFNAWLTAFSRAEDKADQNFDGVLNGADFNAWLTNFANGCD